MPETRRRDPGALRIAGFDAAELAGGLIVFAGGCAVALGATSYRLGELTRMGPGYFPMVVGTVLALMGLGLVLASRSTATSLPVLRLRPALAVFAGLIFWALTIERLGLAPSTLGLVILVSLAQDRPSPVMIGATAIFLIAFSIGVFIYALAIPIPAIRW
jgi:putative tricarboxylic transport membrane protein